MSQLVVWLACYGITFTLCDAWITERLRFWLAERSSFLREMLACEFCTGFWVSLAVHSFTLRGLAEQPLEYVGRVTLHAFAGAVICLGLHDFLTNLTNHDRHPEEK